MEAIHLGALDYLEEPVSGGIILGILDRIQEKIELRKQTFRWKNSWLKNMFSRAWSAGARPCWRCFP